MEPTPKERFGSWLRHRIEERRAGPNSHLARRLSLAPTILCDVLAGRRQMGNHTYRQLCALVGIQGQLAEEGRELLLAAYRPIGREGAKAKGVVRSKVVELVDKLVLEDDQMERTLLAAELKKLIVNL